MEKLYENRGIEAMAVSEDANIIGCKTSNRANTTSGDGTNQTRENRKRKEPEESCSEPVLDDREDESNVPKKKRFIWTSEMHQKFMDAIAQIGEDRAFPKKIVEVMNEPGLTRENVASHLQKYRVCLKKSQEEGLNAATEYKNAPHMYGSSLGNYLPVSSSRNSLLYGIRTGIGAPSVRLAPPSYWCFDVSSLPAVNTENVHSQHCQWTEANKSFQDYGDKERNILLSTSNKRPWSSNSDNHATSSSTSYGAYTGLRIANDRKSLLFGGSDISEIVSTGSSLTKRNEFRHQESAAPIFPTSNIENSAHDSALPSLPYSEDQFLEPALPPLPGLHVENSFPGMETEENETLYGTSRNVDINSFSSGHRGTSFDHLNCLQSLASEILENFEREQNTQIFSKNHTVNSLPPTTSSWNPNTNVASYHLLNQEDSLQPLPSEVPWDLYPDTTTSSSVPQYMDQHNSPLPPLPSESGWNVNPDVSTMDHEHLLPRSPSEIPWNLDSDQAPETYTGNFYDEQNALSDQIIEDALQNLSSFQDDM